jgi:hypothetical protein
MRRKLVKLLGLPWQDQALLAEAALALLAVKLWLLVGGVHHCLAFFDAVRRHRGGQPVREDLARIDLAVRRASAHLPFQFTCLRQSLAIIWLLARRGIKAELRFGAKLNAGALEAHAWVVALEFQWSFDVCPEGGFVPLQNGSPG